MKIDELIALLAAELADDVVGTVSQEGNTLTVTFGDGTTRKITVE